MAIISLFLLDQPTKWSFEDVASGQLPKGFVTAQTNEGDGVDWQVVEYEAGGKKNRALAQVSSKGVDDLFKLCIAKEVSLQDVDLTVSVKVVKGEVDHGGGLVWRYRDAKNYYLARWNPLEDNFRVFHVKNGKRTQLASVKLVLPIEDWHTLRATMKGDHIQCYLDGKLHLDVHDTTFQDAGAIGLWTKADAVTWFDDLTIQK